MSSFATPLLLAALAACVAGPRAQAQRTAELGVLVASANVLPFVSFEGGASHSLAIPVVAGEGGLVSPAAGVRTRLTFATATLVTVRSSRFEGPGGATVSAQLLCASGGAGHADTDTPFDCAAGVRAVPMPGSATSIPLAVGARVTSDAASALPSGLYVGTVTLLGTQSAY